MTIRRIDLSSREAQRAWDARAVDAPGGDVHQGSAWLAYRASLGREAIALEIDDAPLGILLNRAPLFGLPKGHAPRGPIVPWGAKPLQRLMSQAGVGHKAVVQILHADRLTAGFAAQRWIEVVFACLMEKFFRQVLRAIPPFLLPGPNHQGGVVQTQAFAGQVVFMARWVVLVQAWLDNPDLHQ